MTHFIYKTTNLVNGKFYYGKHSTDNINDGYLGSGTLLKKAIQKYDKSNFSREILCFCDSESDVYELEELVVTQVEVDDPMCYNLIPGGYIGPRLEGENHWNYGRVTSDETKNKIRETYKKKFPNSTKKERLNFTDHIKKMSKKVSQFTKSGEFIKTWESTSAAARHLNIKPSRITDVCNGRRKSTLGFSWRYHG
jgi:hypothetical protein